MNNRDNLLGVLSTVYRWRKAIRNICLVTLAGSIAISLFLDNYYRATTIFYPASPELANPELIFGNTGQAADYFGSDRDLDRLTEMANSNEVADYMVRRFHLYEHYDIDSNKIEGPYKVRRQFRRLYSAVKNKNDAIELSVEDTDPELAAQMANAARDKIDEIGRRLIKSSQAKLLATFDENIRHKTADLSILADSIKKLQSFYNIYNVGTQGEELSSRLAEAQSKIVRSRARLEILDNNPLIPLDTIQYIKADLRAYEREREALLSIDSKTENLTVGRYNEGAPLLNVASDLHYQARKQLTYDVERYNQLKAAYNTAIPSIQLLEIAEKPLIKSRPKRSILVITAVLAAFLFAVLAILIADAYRDVRWRDIVTGE